MPLGTLIAVLAVILCVILVGALDYFWRQERQRVVRNVAQVQDELVKWYNLARYALSQTEDDLCWRDFYVKLAELLPENDPLRTEYKLNLKTIPPAHVFLRNCRRFHESLREEKPYFCWNGSPLEQKDAKLPPISAIGLRLVCRRKDGEGSAAGQSHEVYMSFSPTCYASHELFQARIYYLLDTLAESVDKVERGGMPKEEGEFHADSNRSGSEPLQDLGHCANRRNEP